jgi:hypothetical protein
MPENNEDTATGSTDALEQLKKEVLLKKEIAEAGQAIAEADLATLKAKYMTGETKPLEGTITAGEKSGYYAEIVAYSVMDGVADDISEKISGLGLDSDKTRIMMVDSLDVCSADVQLTQVKKQLSYWQGQLNNEKSKIDGLFREEQMMVAIPALPLVMTGLLGSAADIIGYFRVNYDIKGREIKLSDMALKSLIAGRSKYPIYIAAFHRISSSDLLDDYNELIKARTALKTDMARLKDRLDGLAAHGSEKRKKELEAAHQETDTLIKSFDEFTKILVSVPEGKDYSPLAVAMIREYFDWLQITHLLYTKVTSSGGDFITSHGLFQWGKVAFLSGCALTYVLAKTDGQIVAADTLTKSRYVKFKLGQKSPPEIKASV